MDVDVELDSWRRGWHAARVGPVDLRSHVERETRRMRWFVAGDVGITVLFCGGSLAWAVLSRRPDTIVLAAGIWIFTAVAWVISFLLRRDAWAPAALTTSAFLDLSILRCRRRREALVAQALLYLAILVFDLVWIYLARPEAVRPGFVTFLTSGNVAWVWLVTAAACAAAVRYRRRLDGELEVLTSLRRDSVR